MQHCYISVAVCVKYIGKFIDSLDSDTKGDPKKVEKAFMKFCKNSKKGNNRLVSQSDNKMVENTLNEI